MKKDRNKAFQSRTIVFLTIRTTEVQSDAFADFVEQTVVLGPETKGMES